MEPDKNGKPRDATNAVRCLGYLANSLGMCRKEVFEGGGVELVVKRNDPSKKAEAEAETPERVVKLPE